jgi:hypothetical protein
LVAYIGRLENATAKSELYKRAYQECYESVGMCCDGHLARIVNVLVGFDDAFNPPVSQGELIQTRRSASYGMAAPAEETVRLANAFFTELAVGMDERGAWLAALADT